MLGKKIVRLVTYGAIGAVNLALVSPVLAKCAAETSPTGPVGTAAPKETQTRPEFASYVFAPRLPLVEASTPVVVPDAWPTRLSKWWQSYAKNTADFVNNVNPLNLALSRAEIAKAARVVWRKEHDGVGNEEEYKKAKRVLAATINEGLFTTYMKQPDASPEAAAEHATIPSVFRWSFYPLANVAICYTMLERPALGILGGFSQASRAVTFNASNRIFQFAFDYCNRGGTNADELTWGRGAWTALTCGTVCASAFAVERGLLKYAAHMDPATAKTRIGQIAKSAAKRNMSAILPACFGHVFDLLGSRYKEILYGTELYEVKDGLRTEYQENGKTVLSRAAGVSAVMSCFVPRVETAILTLGTISLAMAAADRSAFFRRVPRANLALQCMVIFTSFCVFVPLTNGVNVDWPTFKYATGDGVEKELVYYRGK